MPTEIAARGVGENVLPRYPYRDDGLILWRAIHEFVTDYVTAHYADEVRMRVAQRCSSARSMRTAALCSFLHGTLRTPRACRQLAKRI